MSQVDRIERLLALARDELGPSESDQARSRLALGLPAKPSVMAHIERTAAPVRSWSALRASGRAGLTAGALILGLGFGAGYWMALRAAPAPLEAKAEGRVKGDAALGARERQVPPEPTQTPPRALAVPEITTDANVSSPEPEHSHIRSSAPRARHRPPEGSARQQDSAPAPTGDELALLRRVERALRTGDPALALALLAELEQRFPRTDLVEERAAANVLARCGAAEPEAHALAEQYLRERPTSVYAGRIRTSCGLEGATNGSGEGSNGTGHE